MRICPICKKKYDRPPTLSQIDTEMEICPACGVREALQIAGAAESTISAVLEAIAEHDETKRKEKEKGIKFETIQDFEKPFYTVPEAAEVLQLHENTIYKMCRSRRIEYYKAGNQIRISASELGRLKVPIVYKTRKEETKKPKQTGPHETDIEIINGSFNKEGDRVNIRFGKITRSRKVYKDFQNEKLYVLYKTQRYYKEEFNS